MFEGRDPRTGDLLGRAHVRNAVPAFDVVLRPTKSVSVLYGLGNPATGRAVLAAHHAGLSEAVGNLDEYLGARRGHAGVQHVSGQGLLAVGFDHRTSREGDPWNPPTPVTLVRAPGCIVVTRSPVGWWLTPMMVSCSWFPTTVTDQRVRGEAEPMVWLKQNWPGGDNSSEPVVTANLQVQP
jgi:TrwC relaxase